MTNAEELQWNTDPTNPDTDGDGINDGDEVGQGYPPTDPDADKDGLKDGTEIDLETDPLNPDSDGDLVPDGTEVEMDADPLSSTNHSNTWDVFCGVNGNDETGNGTQDTPYFSVGRAVQDHPGELTPPDTFKIFVGPGTFNLTQTNAWTNQGNLTITGSGIGLTILDGDEQSYSGFDFDGNSQNVEISGFTFFGVDSGVYALSLIHI